MTSSRPYLLRALYDWIVDNGMTPYILVNAEMEGVEVPAQYVEDGKIVFNIGPEALSDIELGNDFVQFGARFSGQHMEIILPLAAVLAIYSRENGKGMVFAEDDDGDEPPPSPGGSDGEDKKPALRVVK